MIIDIIEIIIYIVYIYWLILLAVIFTPNIYTISLLIIYVGIITWNILHTCNITGWLQILVSCLYTIGCVMAYIITHYIWWKMPRYKYILLFGPFMYYATIKCWLYFLGCNPYSNLNYAFKLVKISGSLLNTFIVN